MEKGVFYLERGKKRQDPDTIDPILRNQKKVHCSVKSIFNTLIC